MTSVTEARQAPRDPLPVVGGRYAPALGFRRNGVEYAASMWQAHGDIVRHVIGPPGKNREMWLVHHPDGATRLLSASTSHAYAKRDQVHDEITTWLGPGLLTAEGEDWTRQRRYLQPVFTRAAVEGYADLMVDEIEDVVAEWDVSQAPTVDLSVQMQRLTLRVVVRTLFGDSAEGVVAHVRRSFPTVSDTIIRRAFVPVRLPAWVPTVRARRGRAAAADLFAVCDAIVESRRGGRTFGRTDLLGRLEAVRDSGEELTDDEVRGQVLTFLLAGHETTSIALAFALHLLGRHRDVQDRVRDEVRRVVGDGRPTAASAANLPETTAVLKEAMRLYPSAPFIGRIAAVDDEMLGHPVPAGTTVVVVPWTIHRHPGVWADPLVFDPSRFRGTGARPEPAHRYAWMPFGGGPRGCIGQHFSMVEAVLALAVLLRDHRVTALAGTDHLRVTSLVTLAPVEPVLARLERIG